MTASVDGESENAQVREDTSRDVGGPGKVVHDDARVNAAPVVVRLALAELQTKRLDAAQKLLLAAAALLAE